MLHFEIITSQANGCLKNKNKVTVTCKGRDSESPKQQLYVYIYVSAIVRSLNSWKITGLISASSVMKFALKHNGCFLIFQL